MKKAKKDFVGDKLFFSLIREKVWGPNLSHIIIEWLNICFYSIIEPSFRNFFIQGKQWKHQNNVTTQKMKFFIKDFFRKWDQIFSFLRISSHLLKKSLRENSFFLECVWNMYKVEDKYKGTTSLASFWWLWCAHRWFCKYRVT